MAGRRTLTIVKPDAFAAGNAGNIIALLERQGSLGQILSATVAYELGEWTKAQVDGLSESEVADCYVDAVTWSEELLASMR